MPCWWIYRCMHSWTCQYKWWHKCDCPDRWVCCCIRCYDEPLACCRMRETWTNSILAISLRAILIAGTRDYRFNLRYSLYFIVYITALQHSIRCREKVRIAYLSHKVTIEFRYERDMLQEICSMLTVHLHDISIEYRCKDSLTWIRTNWCSCPLCIRWHTSRMLQLYT